MPDWFDKQKDLLKIGGENVAPTEVGAFLLEHPAVNKAQVIVDDYPMTASGKMQEYWLRQLAAEQPGLAA